MKIEARGQRRWQAFKGLARPSYLGHFRKVPLVTPDTGETVSIHRPKSLKPRNKDVTVSGERLGSESVTPGGCPQQQRPQPGPSSPAAPGAPWVYRGVRQSPRYRSPKTHRSRGGLDGDRFGAVVRWMRLSPSSQLSHGAGGSDLIQRQVLSSTQRLRFKVCLGGTLNGSVEKTFRHHLWYTNTTLTYQNEGWETTHFIYLHAFSMRSYLYIPQQPGSIF